MSAGTTSGRTGRPRSVAADDAILRATLDAIVEHGIHDASVDEIAARAHAGKDTIYRRWPHKEDLIRAALEHALDADLPVLDTPRPSDDVAAYLESLDDLLTAGPTATLLREMVTEAPHDPAVAARLAAFRDRHVSAIAAIIGRTGGAMRVDDAGPVAGVLVDWVCGRRLVGITEDPAIEGATDATPSNVLAWLLGPEPAQQVIERADRTRD